MYTINDLAELADHVTYSFDRNEHTLEDAKRLIARSLYKYTSCGISFYMPSTDTVSVMGYCEGSDREHETYELTFPFKTGDFDAIVAQADADGCETWDNTHGCEECHPEGTCDEWGNVFEPGEAGAPINPDCKHCGGHGIIL